MNYRTATLHAEEDLDASGTKTIDVNVKDPISALIFQTRIVYLTGARLIPEPDALSKIELVDGSDVLLSLSGTEMAALSFYEGNKQINWAATNLLSTTEEGYLRVNFGRFLRDPVLALDPTKFRNLQLKVTYDVTKVQAAATDLYLRVLAECFDEKAISPIGFLQMREFHSYSGGTSTSQYIDLPTDLVLRKLYLQTKGYAWAHFQLLDEIKLSEDNDKRIPFDLKCKDWMDMQLAEFGRLFQNVYALAGGSAQPVFTSVCNVENAVLINASAEAAIRLRAITGGKFWWDSTPTTSWLYGSVQGSLPYFVHCYPFGDQKDMEDWYDVTGIGSLKLKVLSGTQGANGTFNTILQQLRRY